jgi:hypothetical protein
MVASSDLNMGDFMYDDIFGDQCMIKTDEGPKASTDGKCASEQAPHP